MLSSAPLQVSGGADLGFLRYGASLVAEVRAGGVTRGVLWVKCLFGCSAGFFIHVIATSFHVGACSVCWHVVGCAALVGCSKDGDCFPAAPYACLSTQREQTGNASKLLCYLAGGCPERA